MFILNIHFKEPVKIGEWFSCFCLVVEQRPAYQTTFFSINFQQVDFLGIVGCEVLVEHGIHSNDQAIVISVQKQWKIADGFQEKTIGLEPSIFKIDGPELP